MHGTLQIPLCLWNVSPLNQKKVGQNTKTERGGDSYLDDNVCQILKSFLNDGFLFQLHFAVQQCHFLVKLSNLLGVPLRHVFRGRRPHRPDNRKKQKD
jgi:hypothetical protein